MPRDSAGNFTLVPGNPVQSGTVVSSTWANSTLDDVSTALTDSLDRYGRGGMLAPFKFSDGTNLLPGAAWVNEPTTGFYRFDAGDLRAVVLTQDVMRWQSTGAQVWSVDDSEWQNVLTSNTIPTVVPDGTAEGQTLRWDNTGSEWESTSDLVVDSSGNVGIGTSTPSSTLQVNGGASAGNVKVGSDDGKGWIDFQSGAGARRGIIGYLLSDGSDELTLRADGASGFMTFDTGGSTERMRIDSAGNVGIGSTNPEVKLVVDGSTRVTTSFIAPSADNAAAPAYTWNGDTDTGMYRRGEDQIGFSTVGVDRMRISAAGNVGIGGSAVANRRLAISSDLEGLQVLVQSTGVESGIAFNDSNSSNTFNTRLGSKADALTFTTSGIERMRISSGGNVTLGGASGDRVAGTSNGIGQDQIHRFLTLTQTQYNALSPPDANTLYIIV